MHFSARKLFGIIVAIIMLTNMSREKVEKSEEGRERETEREKERERDREKVGG